MQQNLTDITLIVDRSGSMSSNRDEAENAVNHFIHEQQNQEGKCNLTLVQFDTEIDFLYKGKDIQKVDDYSLQPRNMTALLDAVGQAVNHTGERLRKKKRHLRPGTVIVVVMTDGYENSSKEFTKQQINDIKEEQENKYNWKFMFLGADIDAFAEGGGMGMPKASTLGFSAHQIGQAMCAASDSVSEVRYGAAKGEDRKLEFTEEQRKKVDQD